MQIVHHLNEKKWADFVNNNSYGNVFHTPELFKVFEQAKNHHAKLWAVVDNNKNPLALFVPVQISLQKGALKTLTTRAVVYGSVLWEPRQTGLDALSFLLRTYFENTKSVPLFTELRNIFDLTEAQQSLNKYGFKYQPYLNYLINLNLSGDDIFNNIGRRTRRNIRRGLNKNNVVIREMNTKDQLDQGYLLLKQTYRLAQVPLADKSLFDAAVDVLHPKKMFKGRLAYVNDTAVAVSLELFYKKSVFGWYSGVDRNYSKYLPNELLMWHILKSSAEMGYEVYDFGGAGHPDEAYGVRDFKAKFGGKLVNYGRNILIHKPYLLQASKFGYELLRRWL